MKELLKINIFSLLFFLILPLGNLSYSDTFGTLIENGDSHNRVDIVILGDGYSFDEIDLFTEDALNLTEGMFEQQPFQEYYHYFNIHSVEVTSKDSGVDHPELAIYKETAFDGTYNCADIPRLICVNNQKVDAALDDLSLSQRDIIIMLVNDAAYGGSGGYIAVASTHDDIVDLILHELGHSFGGLADEYVDNHLHCNNSIEPPEPNVTMETDRSLIKWNTGGGYPAGWIAADTNIPTLGSRAAEPGLYEGGKYCQKGLFRSTQNSKMRTISAPFEQVNEEQLIKSIYNLVSPIDISFPIKTDLTVPSGDTFVFEVQTPRNPQLTTNWYVNNEHSGSGLSFPLDTSGLGIGTYQVKVVVIDETSKVRHDPHNLLQDSRTWEVTISPRLIDLSIQGLPDNDVIEGNVYHFMPTVLAEPESALWFSIVNKPTWATFSTENGSLSGRPGNVDVGEFKNIVITVNDGEDYVSLPSFIINVINTNDDPVITGRPATSVAEDEFYSFKPIASDIDANTNLLFSIHNKPTWLNFDITTGLISGSPMNKDVGLHSDLLISVTDGISVVSLPSFNINVSNTNDAPAIVGNPDLEAYEDEFYSFSILASDADVGDSLDFFIQNKPSWLSFDTQKGELFGRPLNADVGVWSNIIISVSDGVITSSLPSFDITVINVNDPPIAVADTFTTETNLLLFTTSVIDNDVDADGDRLSIMRADSTSKAGAAVSYLGNGAFTYQSLANFTGIDSFLYDLTDEHGGITQGEVTILVKAPQNTAQIIEQDKKRESGGGLAYLILIILVSTLLYSHAFNLHRTPH